MWQSETVTLVAGMILTSRNARTGLRRDLFRDERPQFNGHGSVLDRYRARAGFPGSQWQPSIKRDIVRRGRLALLASFRARADCPPFDCSRAHSKQGDFFTFTPPSEGYTLAYDYTFFCALPPDLRERWGGRYAELVKPGGVLVCLEFPIGAYARARVCDILLYGELCTTDDLPTTQTATGQADRLTRSAQKRMSGCYPLRSSECARARLHLLSFSR